MIYSYFICFFLFFKNLPVFLSSPTSSDPHPQIAEKLSKHLGKKIEHVKLSDEERTQGMMSNGVPEHTARFLVWLESTAANGQEAQYSDPDVEKVTGKPPQSFDDFVQENKACWT